MKTIKLGDGYCCNFPVIPLESDRYHWFFICHFAAPLFFFVAIFAAGFFAPPSGCFLGLPIFGRTKSFSTSPGIIHISMLPILCRKAPGTLPSRNHLATVGYAVFTFSANSIAVINCSSSIPGKLILRYPQRKPFYDYLQGTVNRKYSYIYQLSLALKKLIGYCPHNQLITHSERTLL